MSFYLIDNEKLRVLCRTESIEDAVLIADKKCAGDFYVGDIGSKLESYTLDELNKLRKSMMPRDYKASVSRSFAVSQFHQTVYSVAMKSPADYGVTPGTKPLSPTLGVTEMTKKKVSTKPAAKKAAPKTKAAKAVMPKAAPKEKAAKTASGGVVWTRPGRGVTLDLWNLFDKLVKAKGATRKGMLDEAVKAKFVLATATTQYGRWLTAHIASGGEAPARSARESSDEKKAA